MLKRQTLTAALLLFAMAVGFSLVGCGGGGGGGGTDDIVPGATVSLSGMLYKMQSSNTLLPLSGATVSVGTASATTNSNGAFAINATPSSSAKVVVDAPNYSEASATVNLSSANSLYLFLQQLDSNKVSLSANASKSEKAAPKKLNASDGSTTLVVEAMALTTDIVVAVTPYKNPNVPPAVNGTNGVEGTICAGSDVSFLKSSNGKKATLAEVGWIVDDATKNLVTPMTTGILGDKDGATLKNMLSQGLINLNLWVYDLTDNSNKVWKNVGSGKIDYVPGTDANSDGDFDDAGDVDPIYTVSSNTSVYMKELYPFVFAYENAIVDPTITVSGTITNSITGAPVEGALVFVYDGYVTTDATGSYSMTMVVPFTSSSVSLYVDSEAYYEVLDVLALSSAVTTYTMDFSLAPIDTTCTVGGYVTDSLTAAGIPDALVTMKTPSVLGAVEYFDNMVKVGMNPIATYLWEYKKSDAVSYTTLKTGLGEAGMNIVSYDEILTEVIGGGDFVGTYNLLLTVTHPLSGTDYVETTEGVFEVSFNKDKLNMSGSITSFGQISIWGGKEVGFYFLSGPFNSTIDKMEWSAQIIGGVAGDEVLVPETILCYSELMYFQAFVEFVTNSFNALLVEDPNTPGVTYLEGGCTLRFKGDVKVTLSNGFVVEGAPEVDIDFTTSDATQLITVQNVYLPASATASTVMYAYTDASGAYSFEDVDPMFNGYLTAMAEETTHMPSDWATVGALVASTTTALDFSLTPYDTTTDVVALEGYAWYFEGADATDWTGDGMWHAVTDPELLEVNSMVSDSYCQFTDNGIEEVDVTVVSITPNEFDVYYADMLLTSSIDITAGYVWDWDYSGTFDLSDEIYLTIMIDGYANTIPIISFDDVDSDGTISTGDTFQIWMPSAGTVTLLPPAQMIDASANTTVWWFGEDATGTYMGYDADSNGTLDTTEAANMDGNNYANSGGNGVGSVDGYLTSPEIDMTTFFSANLSFDSWYEVESVDIAGGQYDQMYVQIRIIDPTNAYYDIFTETDYYTLQGDVWYTLSNLNPESEPPYGSQIAYIPYSSGGIDAAPVWLNYDVNLEPFAGFTVQVRFYFTSNDGLFNGFRGWTIDNVSIANIQPDVTFEFTQLDMWYYKTGNYMKSTDEFGKMMKAKSSRGK